MSKVNEILLKARQFKLENETMIIGAKNHTSINYYKGIDLGIDRVIKLIERNI